MHFTPQRRPFTAAVRQILAAVLICGILRMATNLAAQEIDPDPTHGAEPTPISSDVWLLSFMEEVALYSLDGELQGFAAPGTWFKPVLEEDGWALVHLENAPELLVWILLDAVVSIDFAVESLAVATPTESNPEPLGQLLTQAPTPFPTVTVTPVPTATSTPIGTATLCPSTTPTPTSAATPTVPSATATSVPTNAPATNASPTVALATPTLTSTSPTATRTATPAPTQAPASASVDMRDNSFNPSSVTIRVAGTVTWTNRGAAPHTATRSGTFDSGIKNPGQTFGFTFNAAGTYTYVCQLHSGMSGTVIVQ